MAASGGPWCPWPVAVAHVCLASPCRPLCVSPVRTTVPGFGAHPDLGSRQNYVTTALFPDEVHVPDGRLFWGLLLPDFFPSQLLPSERGMQARLPAPLNRHLALRALRQDRRASGATRPPPQQHWQGSAGRQSWGPRGKGKTKAASHFRKDMGHGAHGPSGHAASGDVLRHLKRCWRASGLEAVPTVGFPAGQLISTSFMHPCFSRFWVRCLKSIHVWAGSLWGLRGRTPQPPGSGLCPAPGLCSPHPTLCFCCFIPFSDRPSHCPLGRTLIGTRPPPRRLGQSPPKSLH